jgi:hypothetical protein
MQAPCKIWTLPFLDGKIIVTMGSQIAAPAYVCNVIGEEITLRKSCLIR